MERVYRPPKNPTITRLGRFAINASSVFKIDALPQARAQGVQSDIRSVWCDVSRQPSGVRIFAPSTGARESWPAGTIGWGSIWAVDDCQLELTTNRTIAVEIMVSSDIIPPFIHDAGDIHPVALDQSEHVAVTASATQLQLLGPGSNAMNEDTLQALGRCGYALRNASDQIMYVFENDMGPNVDATRHTYALDPGEQIFRNVPYANEVHAVAAAAVTGTWQLTAYYREQF